MTDKILRSQPIRKMREEQRAARNSAESQGEFSERPQRYLSLLSDKNMTLPAPSRYKKEDGSQMTIQEAWDSDPEFSGFNDELIVPDAKHERLGSNPNRVGQVWSAKLLDSDKHFWPSDFAREVGWGNRTVVSDKLSSIAGQYNKNRGFSFSLHPSARVLKWTPESLKNNPELMKLAARDEYGRDRPFPPVSISLARQAGYDAVDEFKYDPTDFSNPRGWRITGMRVLNPEVMTDIRRWTGNGDWQRSGAGPRWLRPKTYLHVIGENVLSRKMQDGRTIKEWLDEDPSRAGFFPRMMDARTRKGLPVGPNDDQLHGFKLRTGSREEIEDILRTMGSGYGFTFQLDPASKRLMDLSRLSDENYTKYLGDDRFRWTQWGGKPELNTGIYLPYGKGRDFENADANPLKYHQIRVYNPSAVINKVAYRL